MQEKRAAQKAVREETALKAKVAKDKLQQDVIWQVHPTARPAPGLSDTIPAPVAPSSLRTQAIILVQCISRTDNGERFFASAEPLVLLQLSQER